MPKRILCKLDPGVCPKCRSVATELLHVGANNNEACTERVCRSCQAKYIQYFNASANMSKDSPTYITDLDGKTIWQQ